MLGLLSLLYILLIAIIFVNKPGYLKVQHDIFSMHSCWSYIRSFFEIFGIQVYFLWILQTQKRPVLIKKRKEIIWYPTTGIYIAALLFVLIAYLSVNLFTDDSKGVYSDPESVYEGFVKTPLGLAEAIVTVLIQFFSFPFQFYIGKDFFFMLYDELKHRSISKKIDQLKSFTSNRNVYTEDMLQKIDETTYEVVRQPYMKYSPKVYYSITVSLYLVNCISVVPLIISMQSDQTSVIRYVNELFLLWKSPI
jgi:hypothetical protein